MACHDTLTTWHARVTDVTAGITDSLIRVTVKHRHTNGWTWTLRTTRVLFTAMLLAGTTSLTAAAAFRGKRRQPIARRTGSKNSASSSTGCPAALIAMLTGELEQAVLRHRLLHGQPCPVPEGVQHQPRHAGLRSLDKASTPVHCRHSRPNNAPPAAPSSAAPRASRSPTR